MVNLPLLAFLLDQERLEDRKSITLSKTMEKSQADIQHRLECFKDIFVGNVQKASSHPGAVSFKIMNYSLTC